MWKPLTPHDLKKKTSSLSWSTKALLSLSHSPPAASHIHFIQHQSFSLSWLCLCCFQSLEHMFCSFFSGGGGVQITEIHSTRFGPGVLSFTWFSLCLITHRACLCHDSHCKPYHSSFVCLSYAELLEGKVHIFVLFFQFLMQALSNT